MNLLQYQLAATLALASLMRLAVAAPETPPASHINPSTLMEHIRVLSSDAFEGRGPGTPGEEKSVAYITDQFKKFGLEPGNPNGTYTQDVPVVRITGAPEALFSAGGTTLNFNIPSELVLWSGLVQPEVSVENSDIVFVGYGVVAPEYNWNDFKDVDVRGKTILCLINDPAVPDPNNPGKLDPSLFKGKEMTYYGRWTYKYEEAGRKGAQAAIIIHETEPAAYPFNVVINSNARERFELKEGDSAKRCLVEGWIAFEAAQKLCAAAGADLAELKKAALSRDFKPRALNAKTTIHIKNSFQEIGSRNVLALLPGSSARLKDELLIYSAHWDHLGRDPRLQGDQIYNGALDNASGVAGLLELARVFAAGPAPQRSILFLAVTAEEKGLLGSKYYATHPLYPINRTVANLNMDGINPLGRTEDLEVIGLGKTTIEDMIAKDLKKHGRHASPDSEPEKGYFYRSDHFEFAKVGVPSLHFSTGTNFIGKPADYGIRKKEEYTAHDYHKVSDEIKPDWDLTGGAEDVEVLYRVGQDIASGQATPEWKKGAEFHR
jgi:Zn-dependent M28 family amino/carboxypeptidase